MSTDLLTRRSAGARAPSGPRRRRLPDRETGLALLLLAPIVVATVTWSYVLELSTWRVDVMQAADRAGLYLFFLNPCYAAIAAWAAVRAREGVGDVAASLPAPALIWRRAWLPYAWFGLVAHVLVLLLMVGTAVGADAIGSVEPLAVLVQLLSIPFFAALGAVCAGRWSSRLTAPAVLLTLLAANTLLIQYGFRRISEVGTGSADFIDLSMRTGYLLPKALLFATLVAYAAPVRTLATRSGRWVQGGAAVAAAACFLQVFTTAGSAQVWDPSTPVCHQAGATTICVPEDLAGRAAALDAPVERAVGLVQGLGVTAVPHRVEVVSRGATALSPGAVSVTVMAADLTDPRALRRDVAFGFGYAQGCDDPTSAVGPPDNVIVTRALLDGWLQHETDAVTAGTFPEQDLDRLLALPAARRAQALRSAFTAVWQCNRSVQPFGSGR